MRVASLAGLAPDCLSSHTILVETDRGLARRDPRRVFASAAERLACEMAVGMSDSTTRDGGREVAARPDDGGPWRESARTTALLARGGGRWQRRARVGRLAAVQKGGRIVFRGAATSTSASRIDWAGDEGRRATGAHEGEMPRQRDGRVLQSGRRMQRKGKGVCRRKRQQLGEDGPHTRSCR